MDKEKERKLQYRWYHNFRSYLVHLTGIEPARLSVLDPKSNASASSATGAYYIFFALVYYNKYFIKFQ